MLKKSNPNSHSRVIHKFLSDFFRKIFGVYEISPKRQALRITYIYFLIGSMWILFSDKLLEFLIKDPSIIFMVSIVKGWFYVLISSILIFFLIFTSIKKIVKSKAEINEKLEENIKVEIELNRINERLQKYQVLSEKANDAMLFMDKEGNILEVNDAAIRIYGYTYKEFTSMNIFELRRLDKPSLIKDQMEKSDTEGIIFETVHYLKSGIPIPVEVSSQGTSLGDKKVLLSIVRNITERKKAQEEIIYLSYHDQLTGLYNRRFYEEELKRLDTERNFPITLIMADVNGLKLTNDAFGHLAGDRFLEKISNVLKKECRADEIVARIGGDEFVLLLPGTDDKEAEKVVQRIHAAIKLERTDKVILSASIGFAVKQNISQDMNDIFKKAEDDMYRHKLSESPGVRSKTIDLILNSLYKKNDREMLHNKNVSEICEAIAIKMNFEKDEVNQIRIAGLMHDIGKIGIDDNILNNLGKLNAEEWKEIKRHSEIGYRILSSVNEFSEVAQYVLEHHERWDGNGYPKGLKGEEILLQGRIIAVADAYTAMISASSYRESLSEAEAVAEIKRYSGVQFDTDIAKVFVEKVLEKKW